MKTTKTVFVLLVVTVSLAVQVHAQTFLTNGLVAYYPFNGNANDASGLGKDGVVVNATLAPDRFGTPQSAFAFNGNNAVITIASNLFNVGQPEYTITAWFMSTDVNQQIQDIFDTDVHTGIAISFNNNNSPQKVDFDVGPANAFWDRLHVSGTKSDYQNGQWYHMAFTKRGTLYTLFINGSWSCEATVPAAANYNTLVHGVIGGYGTAPFSEFFKGSIDDFRVYSRALSTNEVAQLYAYESAPQLTDGLVAYYPFNGNANDASGNGNNGQITAGTFVSDRFGNLQGAFEFPNVPTPGSVAGVLTTSLQAPGNVFTLSAWFKATPQGEGQLITFGDSPSGHNSQSDRNLIFAGDKITFYVFPGSQVVLEATNLVSYGQWHSAVATLSGAGMKLYLDGVMVTNNPSVTTAQPFSGYWQMARTFGDIDDVRIYNRALSASEVQQLYVYESQPCTPHRATATAVLNNGFVVAATITDGGCGYTNAPLVLIQGGGGTGATATAVVSNGVVVGITITDAGVGYTNSPTISVASPPFVPWLEIGVSKVRVSQHVVLGKNYVLESSTDLQNWNQVGLQFTAQTEVITQEFAVDLTGRYFRIRQVP